MKKRDSTLLKRCRVAHRHRPHGTAGPLAHPFPRRSSTPLLIPLTDPQRAACARTHTHDGIRILTAIPHPYTHQESVFAGVYPSPLLRHDLQLLTRRTGRA